MGAAVDARMCHFSHNEASGCWVACGGAATLACCHLAGNSCNGAAVWDVSSRLHLRGCSLSNNFGNGCRALYRAAATARDCYFAGNGTHALEVGCGARVDCEGGSLEGASVLDSRSPELYPLRVP